MDTPFAPKTHISKRIKLWAIILLVAVILASGLAMLTGGKTRLFKGAIENGIDMDKVPTVSVEQLSKPENETVEAGQKITALTLKFKVNNYAEDVKLTKLPVTISGNQQNIEKISLFYNSGTAEEKEIEYPLNGDIEDQNVLIKSGSTISIRIQFKEKAEADTTFQLTADPPSFNAKPSTYAGLVYVIGKQIVGPKFTIKPILNIKLVGSSSLSTVKQGEEKEIMKFTIDTNYTGAVFEYINLIQQETPEKVADLKKSILMISASLDASLASGDLHTDLETSFTNEGIKLTTPAKLFIFEANETATITIKATIEDKAEIGKTIKFAIPEIGGLIGLVGIVPTGLPIETSLFAIVSKTGTGPSPDFGAPVDLMLDQIEKAAEEAAKAAQQITPKLTIKIDPNTTQAQTVTSGDVDATKLLLTTTNDEDVEIKALTVTRGGITDTTSTDISSIDINGLGLFLYDEKDEPLANTASLTNLKSKLAYVFELNKYQPSKWIIPKNSTRKLTIKANISSKAPEGNTFQLGILSNLAITASTNDIQVGEGVNPLTSSVMGNLFTIKAEPEIPPAGAQLTVSKSADSPASKEIKPGETNVEVAKFDLQATNQDLNIQKLNISAVNENDQLLSPQDIKSITVWLESAPTKKTTIDLPGPYAAAGINIEPNFLIPQNTPQKLVIAVNTNATAVNGHKFKVGFVDAGGVIVEGGKPVTINQLKGNLFTIAVADPTNTPAGAQLTVSKSTPEIVAGTITAGSSADVLKLKFQATEADITISSIKITTQGPAPVTDLQSFKLIDGTNVIGSSTDIVATTIGATTLIATPSFTILKGVERQLTLNVTAKSGAVKDNIYLFKIAANTDISALPQNVFLEPGNELLSSQAFTIATAGTGTSSTPTAPTVSLTASPSTSQTAGQQALFTITVNNGPGGTYDYSIDFGNGTKQAFSSTLNTASFTSDYKAEVKDYTVTASVSSQTVDGPLKTPLPATPLTYKITTADTTLVTFENTCKSIPNAIWTPANNNCTLNGTIYNSETSFKTAIEAVATAQAKALADLQQQLANSQNAQSTAQITALNKQITDLIALNAAKEASAKAKSIEEAAKKLEKKKKSKTPVETPAMWGPTPTQAPVYVPPAPGAPSSETTNLQNQIAALQQQFAAGQMYASAPSLGYSQKLVKVPDKSNTGPEVLVYFIAVGAANAAWWIRRKVRK